jgi:single-strand DNA-binding protein
MIMEKYVGNITKDATGKDVNGNHVTNFTVALNRRVKTGGQWTKKAVYLQCALWGNPKVEPYLIKGALVDVSGDTEADYFEKKGGGVVAFLKLNVRDLNLHSSGKENASASNAVSSALAVEPEGSDDLPF